MGRSAGMLKRAVFFHFVDVRSSCYLQKSFTQSSPSPISFHLVLIQSIPPSRFSILHLTAYQALHCVFWHASTMASVWSGSQASTNFPRWTSPSLIVWVRHPLFRSAPAPHSLSSHTPSLCVCCFAARIHAIAHLMATRVSGSDLRGSRPLYSSNSLNAIQDAWNFFCSLRPLEYVWIPRIQRVAPEPAMAEARLWSPSAATSSSSPSIGQDG